MTSAPSNGLGATRRNNSNMAEANEGAWYNRYKNDLTDWGVKVPEGILFDELKKLHAAEKKKRREDPLRTEDAELPDLGVGPMSKEDVIAAIEAYMAKREKQSAGGGLSKEDLREVMMAVKEGNKDERGRTRPDYVPPDDRIAPVTFFAPWIRYVVPEKWNGSTAEAIPLGIDMLFFKGEFGYLEAGSMGVGPFAGRSPGRRKFISTLKVESHSVYKWLTGKDIDGNVVGEPHPDFGRMFYLNASGAVNETDNSLWTQTFKKHEHALANRKFHELVTMAEKNGLPTTSSWNSEQYRAAIAEKLTNIEFERVKEEKVKALRDRQAGAMLLRSEGVMA